MNSLLDSVLRVLGLLVTLVSIHSSRVSSKCNLFVGNLTKWSGALAISTIHNFSNEDMGAKHNFTKHSKCIIVKNYQL